MAANDYELTRQDTLVSPVPDKPLPDSPSITRERLTEELKYDLGTYGIRNEFPLAEKVIFCESGWNPNAKNRISTGIAQFTKPTWRDFGMGDIGNPYDQLLTFAKMWGEYHLQSRWDCYRRIKETAG